MKIETHVGFGWHRVCGPSAILHRWTFGIFLFSVRREKKNIIWIYVYRLYSTDVTAAATYSNRTRERENTWWAMWNRTEKNRIRNEWIFPIWIYFHQTWALSPTRTSTRDENGTKWATLFCQCFVIGRSIALPSIFGQDERSMRTANQIRNKQQQKSSENRRGKKSTHTLDERVWQRWMRSLAYLSAKNKKFLSSNEENLVALLHCGSQQLFLFSSVLSFKTSSMPWKCYLTPMLWRFFSQF